MTVLPVPVAATTRLWGWPRALDLESLKDLALKRIRLDVEGCEDVSSAVSDGRRKYETDRVEWLEGRIRSSRSRKSVEGVDQFRIRRF